MSNYKWVKMHEGCIELRCDNFSPFPYFVRVTGVYADLIVRMLPKKSIEVTCCSDPIYGTPYVYELKPTKRRRVKITAPLYEYDFNTGKYVLLESSYTDTMWDPAQYEWIKETYRRCEEKFMKEHEKT